MKDLIGSVVLVLSITAHGIPLAVLRDEIAVNAAEVLLFLGMVLGTRLLFSGYGLSRTSRVVTSAETITTTQITRRVKGQQAKRGVEGKDRLAVTEGAGYG